MNLLISYLDKKKLIIYRKENMPPVSEEARARKQIRDMKRYTKLVAEEYQCDICGKMTNKVHYKKHNESMYHKYTLLQIENDQLKDQLKALNDKQS